MSDIVMELLRQAEYEKASRAIAMPTELAAASQMRQAYIRLVELGWRDAIYCPKDGTDFDAIDGSGQIYPCFYMGEWPDGSWMAYDPSDGDCGESYPSLFRLIEKRPPREVPAFPGYPMPEVMDDVRQCGAFLLCFALVIAMGWKVLW